MGTTYWSDGDYRRRAERLRRAGKDAFEYHDLVSRMPARQRHVHQKMNPCGVNRESRDSQEHPESRAVAVLFDVTGSMGTVPRILQRNLCGLMDLLLRKNYLPHPQILVGGIGDATCDRAPLQVGQFESGVEIDEDLAKLWLEGGGGGKLTESYELAMYFMARKTSIDCQEKRTRRGYLFLIGDEMPYPRLKRDEVAEIVGDPLRRDIFVEDLVEELALKYDTWFIVPNLSSYYDDPRIYRRWCGLLGRRVVRLEDPEAISELIAAIIGISEGTIDLGGVEDDLNAAGRGDTADAVVNALVPVVQNSRDPHAGRQPRLSAALRRLVRL
jgi:hypothetical protein